MLYKTSKKDFALEIIRDDNMQQTLMGFKEIDPDTLTPNKDEFGNSIWIQFNNSDKKRILFDSQIIFVKTNS